jgi:triacylglycerol lipase
MPVLRSVGPDTVVAMGDNLEQVIGVLNGAVGDYLKRTGNGLATPMEVIRDGKPVALEAEALRAAFGESPSPRLVVLVHGLMSTEIVWRMPDGEDYGSLLARDLGVTPVYLRFNSGLHVSENGEALDALLEQLVAVFPVPVEALVLLGHSMGGLVIRSACHAAGTHDTARRWLPLVSKAFYLGSPHLGAPLERFGNVVTWALGAIPNPYTRIVADIINLRSSGVKDLRYANLRREDWEGADADALLQNLRHPVPLLPHIRHHLVAGTLVDDPQLALLFGDALVPLDSAAGRAQPHHRSAIFPQEHVRVLPSFDHLRLAHHADVYAAVRAWFEEAA